MNFFLGVNVDGKTNSVVFHVKDDVIVWEEGGETHGPVIGPSSFVDHEIAGSVVLPDVGLFRDEIWFSTKIKSEIWELCKVFVIPFIVRANASGAFITV